MTPDLAIIVPTHRRSALLLRALRSVYAQKGRFRAELVVVDDGGTETRERLAAALPADERLELRLITNAQRRGGAGSRNDGTAQTTAPLLFFLDDDDEWLPEKIETLLPLFADPAVALVSSQMLVASLDERASAGSPALATVTLEELVSTNVLGGASQIACTRAAFDAVGGFDAALPSMQDYDLWLRLALAFPDGLRLVDRALVRYHDHAGERITTDFAAQIAGRLAFLAKFDALLPRAAASRLAGHILATILIRAQKTGASHLPGVVGPLLAARGARDWLQATRILGSRGSAAFVRRLRRLAGS